MMQENSRVGRSVFKTAGAFATVVGLVAIGVWLIQGGAVDSRGEISVFVGWLTTIVCGIGLLILFGRLLFGGRYPLQLSAQGFLENSLLKKEVPWNAVSRISIVSNRRTPLLRIQISDQDFLNQHLTFLGRVTRCLNYPFGRDEIYVSSVGLDASFSELSKLFRTHLAEFNPSAVDETVGGDSD